MGDLIVGIAEVVLGLVAHAIYGDGSAPRHHVQRGLFRGAMTAGTAGVLAFIGRGGLEEPWGWPIAGVFAWFLGGFIMLTAEHELGRGWLSVAAGLVMAAAVALGIRAELA